MFERFKRTGDADGSSERRGGVATEDHPTAAERSGARAERRFGREEGTSQMETREQGDDRGLKDKARDAVTPDRGRERDRDRDRGREAAPGLDPATVRARQRDEFGGFNWGSAFFGWLVAVGMAALLIGLISAIGAAVGLTENATAQDAAAQADTISIIGGILLLAAMMLAYYAGGYVAGRMSRFDGARQGLGVWLIGLIVTIALAAAGAVLGAEYNVLQQLNLPRIPVDQGSLTTGGVIALAAILLGTLFAAVTGGKVGQRYHNKVDRAGGLR